jgi:hypothetical protein
MIKFICIVLVSTAPTLIFAENFSFSDDNLHRFKVTDLVSSKKFDEAGHNEYSSTGENKNFITGLSYKSNQNKLINYAVPFHSVQFPSRFISFYDVRNMSKSSYSPNMAYLLIPKENMYDDYNDDGDKPIFLGIKYKDSCQMLNTKTGCMVGNLNKDYCYNQNSWKDNNTLLSQNSYPHAITDKADKLSSSFRKYLLTYVKSHRDFKTSKNQDNQEWIQENFGVENIDACTQ